MRSLPLAKILNERRLGYVAEHGSKLRPVETGRSQVTILSFLRRRTLLKYADDKAVQDFALVCDETGVLTEQQRIDEAAKIIGSDNVPTADDVERLGNLLN